MCAPLYPFERKLQAQSDIQAAIPEAFGRGHRDLEGLQCGPAPKRMTTGNLSHYVAP